MTNDDVDEFLLALVTLVKLMLKFVSPAIGKSTLSFSSSVMLAKIL